jgi:hypothetical protein
MSDSSRLDALEQAVRDLALEVERLRAELREAREAGAGTSVAHGDAARSPRRAPPTARREEVAQPPRWQSLGLETLIGRYGALVLAALAILLGVGVFLSWAVENIRIGPAARVALGAAAASAVAILGAWLRSRGARRFGNVLLGLALAIAHVVAWGAGPYLGVVPSSVALIAAAAASAALAFLAWREQEEALFAVGLGGAMIAPFVTSAGRSAIPPLLAYGVLVLGSGMIAVGDRAWRVAVRLLVLGFGLYAGAALAMPGGVFGNRADAVARAMPAVFALVCAWLAIVLGGSPHRLTLGRAALAVAVLALLTSGLASEQALDVELIVVAVAASLTTYVLRRRAGPDLRASIILPIGSLLAALTAIPEPASTLGGLLAAGWAVLAIAASRAEAEGRRNGDHFVAVAALGIAIVLILHERPELCVMALAALAALSALAAHRVEPAGLIAGGVLALVTCTSWALQLLADRVAFAYTPFLSLESAAAAASVVAWWVWSRSALRWREPIETRAGHGSVLRMLAPAVTFGWGYVELAGAFNRQMATFLVILYLAACGVAAIVLGRARALPAARHIGLALAILAGLRALWQAGGLAFGLRLTTYLVVGAFLLGVAYLYRATSEPTSTPPAEPRVAGS